MKTHYTVTLAMVAGFGLGAVAVQGLHAQAKAPVISEVIPSKMRKFACPLGGASFIPLAPLRRGLFIEDMGHIEPIRHSLREMPDHPPPCSWDGNRERLASRRSEFDDVGAIRL